MSTSGWIGVDLDGTLAQYGGWRGVGNIGAPVPLMVARVRRWLAEGREVKIFTARVAVKDPVVLEQEVLPPINAWSELHLGQRLEVTCSKDFGMIELWDDRCVQVEPNTGRAYGPSTRGLE